MHLHTHTHTHCGFYNIMAAVRLIGSLYIYSEAGGSAGPGGGPQGRQLEEIGESRARQGREPARGQDSL